MKWIAPVALWVIIIIIGAIIGKRKGRLGEGIAWTVFLTWIGLIIIACRRPAAVMQVRNAAGSGAYDQPASKEFASGEHVLNKFYASHGGTYYDGRPHSIGNLSGTLTKTSLMITEDIRGRTFQIPLGEITSIDPHGGLNKYLDIKYNSAGIRIYGKRNDELSAIASMINHAIRSQFS
jgi:hypothetical protein